MSFASVKDFQLLELDSIASDVLLKNPYISLYSLDFERQLAIFVELPADVSLSAAPFYWLTQYENAIAAYTLPFSEFLALTNEIVIDDAKLLSIYSVGRAGSTLVSQLFASVGDVESISEPDVLTLLVAARYLQPEREKDLKPLMAACISFLCKTNISSKWSIKGRSQVSEICDWINELYPQSKALFLYRDAETWLASAKQAFLKTETRTSAERIAMEQSVRAYLKPVTHLIAACPDTRHLSAVELLVLTWLSAMENGLALSEMECSSLSIRFEDWQVRPLETAIAVLEYFNSLPSDLSGVLATLASDAQANTPLSRDSVRRRSRELHQSDLDILNDRLQQHSRIKVSDFRVPGTLSFPRSVV